MKPIIFNSEMIKAVLDGRKTMTRRIIKPQPDKRIVQFGKANGTGWKEPLWQGMTGGGFDDCCPVGDWIKCPFGKVGDELWVRESFVEGRIMSVYRPPNYAYEANMYTNSRTNPQKIHVDFKWKPASCMPREASRITLEIKDVRIERVQEIGDVKDDKIWKDIFWIEDFIILGNSIYGPDAWDRNDWVWVVELKIIDANK